MLMELKQVIKMTKKNNSGRDVMIDSPSDIDEAQLKELNITLIS